MSVFLIAHVIRVHSAGAEPQALLLGYKLLQLFLLQILLLLSEITLVIRVRGIPPWADPLLWDVPPPPPPLLDIIIEYLLILFRA